MLFPRRDSGGPWAGRRGIASPASPMAQRSEDGKRPESELGRDGAPCAPRNQKPGQPKLTGP